MSINKLNQASEIRHKLNRRGQGAIYEFDPEGIRAQIHYDETTKPKLNIFNSYFQSMNSECFGLYEKLLKILKSSSIQN